MSAERDLQADYQEWRQLAEAEGEAIRAGDWIHVCNCQNALKLLQPRIIQHTSVAQETWSRPDGNRAAHEENVRAMVRPLVDLEHQNYRLLEARMSAAQAELDKFEQASHTLRRLQRSYAPTPPAAWTSFS